MKKFDLLMFLLLFSATASIAQYQTGSKIVTFTGGWSLMNIEESSNSVGGFETGGSFEQTSNNGKWAYGVSLTLIKVTDETTGRGKSMYRTTPFTLQGKYMFGGSDTKFYLQGNLGGHHSSIERDGISETYQNWDYGVVIGGGAGIHKFVSEKVYVTLAYNLKWLQNSNYKEGVLHTFLGGLGFQFQ